MKRRPVRTALLAASALIATSVAVAAPAGASTGSNQQFTSFTASNGASSNYHYYPSNAADSGLLIYLDGDGQWGHDNPSSSYALGGSSGIVAQAKARGLDVMSVKTPDRKGSITWWEDCSRNEVYLTDLLNKVRSERGIDNNDIWITGFSGGAQFTTQCYLPKKANTLGGGGTVVFGGGGQPYTTVTPFTQATKDNLDLHWITGAEDTGTAPEWFNALRAAQAGHSYYTGQGFDTFATWPAGVDHDEIGGQFGTYIGQAIDVSRAAAPAPTPPPPAPEPPPAASPWATTVEVGRNYADVTVNVPSDARGTTTVWAYGPRGTYWYEHVSGTGSKTVRMGDPGDMLRPGTDYTYKVVNRSTTYAQGSFTTTR